METYFNINELIQKGKDSVRNYELPVGTVVVRPLTDLEINEADALAFDAIDDQVTKKYMMSMTEAADAADMPDGVKMGEILKASAEVNVYIAYLAMKNFTDDLTLDLVKQLPGIAGLADYVREISGVGPSVKATVDEFRE